MISQDPQQQRRQTIDALRSLGRLMGHALEDQDYSVYLSPDEVTARRSVALRILDGRTSTVASHTVTIIQPFAIYVYPPMAETSKDGELEALEVANRLDEVFEIGIDQLSFPSRAPMWDWSTTKTDEAMADEDDVVIDYYVVQGYTSRALPDPDDARRWTVSATLRLQWSRHPGLVIGTPLVESVGVGDIDVS